MSQTVGFTQLGRRLAPLEKKELARTGLLSIVIVNLNAKLFSLHSIEAAYAIIRELDGNGEVIFVDCDASQERSEALLKQFPDLRLIVPAEKIDLAETLFLGAEESLTPHLLFIDSSVVIDNFSVKDALATFSDPQLFAIGGQMADINGESIHSVVKAFFDKGRVHMIEGSRSFQAASLYLKNFIGLYSREKILLLGHADNRMARLWCGIDFFYGSWCRGWTTLVDPVYLFRSALDVESVLVGRGFRARYRYYRDELLFLRKNFIDKESRRYRRKLLYSYGLRRFFCFDPSLLCACLTTFFAKIFLGRRLRKRSEAAYTPAQVFAKLMEGSS